MKAISYYFLWIPRPSWLLPKVVKSGGPYYIPQQVLRSCVYGRDACRRLYGHTQYYGVAGTPGLVYRHMMLHMLETFSTQSIENSFALPHVMEHATFVWTESVIKLCIGFICGAVDTMNLYECPINALCHTRLEYSHVQGIFRGIV